MSGNRLKMISKFTQLLFCSFFFINAIYGNEPENSSAEVLTEELDTKNIDFCPTVNASSMLYIFHNRIWKFKNVNHSDNSILNYSGTTEIQNEQNLVVFMCPDSSYNWQILSDYETVFELSPFDGNGQIIFNSSRLGPNTRFALAEKIPAEQANRPIHILAQVTYGPVRIFWETRFENENKSFAIERKLQENHWESLGFQPAQNMSVFPVKYSFEDVSIFPEGTCLYYRIRQENKNGDTYYSPDFQINYFPRLDSSGFKLAALDTLNSCINLVFNTAFTGNVKINLFNRQVNSGVTLFEKVLVQGSYSALIDLQSPQNLTNFSDGFCRFEINAPKMKLNFIQIKSVQKAGK